MVSFFTGKASYFCEQGRSQPECCTLAKCYKTFCVRNLRIFVVSQSICSWQSFPAQPNVCGLWVRPGACPISIVPKSWFTWVGSGLICKHQTRLERILMLRKFVNYVGKKFYNIGPWTLESYPTRVGLDNLAYQGRTLQLTLPLGL